jgi:hypothetical protein
MCIVAVPCSCVVIHNVNPTHAVHPCAPDVAPLRYPTHAGKKRRASGLLGPRGAISVSVGEQRQLPNSVRSPWQRPLPLLCRRPLISPKLEAQLENPKPCLIRVQPELGFYPLKRATLWAHVHIDMGRVLLTRPIVDSGL